MKTEFKKVFYILALFMISCVEKEEGNASVSAALKRASTDRSIEEQQMDLNDDINSIYTEALEEIEGSLNSIIEMRGIVKQNSSMEGIHKISHRDKIIQGIQILNSLLLESDKKIEQLKLQVRKADAGSETLNRIINQMERKLENENEKVMTLKSELSKKDYEIEDLTARIDELESQNIKLTTKYLQLFEESRTAYMTVGTYKELKEKGIIDKQGGILNLGGVSVLNGNFTDEYFDKLNIEKSTMIPIDGKKINLITEHSKESYELKQVNENKLYLHIIHPKEFWKVSRYLVVQKL